MTSVITSPEKRYSRLPKDVQARLQERLQPTAVAPTVTQPRAQAPAVPTQPTSPPRPEPQPQARPRAAQAKSNAKAMVSLQNVSKTYRNGSQALINVDLRIGRGDFLYVTGPSGAGKSTLLKLLYGQERPTSGGIVVNDQPLSKLRGNKLAHLRRQIGVVFQDYKLIPRRTVSENVAFVLWAQGYTRKEINRRLIPTLKMVGLQNKADCFPEQLSGGEQQRVSIARAVVGTPPLLLADEPTGNLDADNSWQVIKILEKLNSIGITVIVTTHDEHIVRASTHPVIQIQNGHLQYVRR